MLLLYSVRHHKVPFFHRIFLCQVTNICILRTATARNVIFLTYFQFSIFILRIYTFFEGWKLFLLFYIKLKMQLLAQKTFH
jgi:hypothetical protein